MKRLSIDKTIAVLKGILKLHTTPAVIAELQWVDKHAYNTNGKSDTLDDIIIYYHLSPNYKELNYQQKLDLALSLPLKNIQKETHMCLRQATFTRNEMTDTDNYQYWATRNDLMSNIYYDTRDAWSYESIEKLSHDSSLIEQVFNTVHDDKALHILNKIEKYYPLLCRQHCSNKYNNMIINQVQPRINYYINQICGWEINVQLPSDIRQAFRPLNKSLIKHQLKKVSF